ncbi:MAG: UvrD-helicase domain-containing protein, partial [Pseudomonadota bacterium]
MRLDDATRAQVAAADPRGSSWLMANAGSGKTRVLTNRVAWLLLNGAPPERILCLTFTKAAAAEMQNRLFGQLGGWAMLDDGALSDELAAMGIAADARRPEALAGARTLFARAIEAPGGLKIQTIHAFAAAILRRFPLEAGVSPTFTETDGRAQAQVMDAALHGLASGPEAEVVARVAGYLSGSDMRDLTKAVLGARLALGRPDTDPADWLGLPPGLTEAGILAGVFLGEEATLCARLAGHLDPGNKQQAPMLDRLSAFPWHAPTLPALADLEAVFLTGAQAKAPHTAKVGSFANAAVRTALGADLPHLEAFMMRIETARDLRLGLAAAEQAATFARFGRAFLPRYDAEMAARGAVDFDDLIRRARTLLTDTAIAPWVLYRLDGGVDHLLVDEAQDTSPAQWAIVRAVAEEFAAGHGARTGVARTLFVVGDEKQSIYSFQDADPDVFAEMR